jgi:hypothetical protein
MIQDADSENWRYLIKTRILDADWDSQLDLRHWLRLHVGEPYLNWTTTPFVDDIQDGYIIAVKLKREQDAVLVALRWS